MSSRSAKKRISKYLIPSHKREVTPYQFIQYCLPYLTPLLPADMPLRYSIISAIGQLPNKKIVTDITDLTGEGSLLIVAQINALTGEGSATIKEEINNLRPRRLTLKDIVPHLNYRSIGDDPPQAGVLSKL